MRAAKKAAKTRARNKAHRSTIARKAGRKGARCKKAKTAKSRKRNCAPKSRRRSSPKRRAKRKTGGARKSPKRVRAAKKAAATRRRNRAYKANLSDTYVPVYEGKRRKRRKSRKARETVAAAPKRRRRARRGRKTHARRRTSRRRHHVRAVNPISGVGEFAAAIGGIVLGAMASVLGDRYAAGHALTASGTTYVDQPAAGQLYNSNASSAPIWSNWKRIVVAGANLVVPFGASMAAKRHPKTQTLFQTWFFSALAVTLGKVTLDVLPKMLGTKSVGARLLAPEIDAQNARASVKASNIALPGYTLVAGGTGPVPVTPPTGGTMLGSPRQTLGGVTAPEGAHNNYPGYVVPDALAPSTPVDTSLPTASSAADGSDGCGPESDPDEDEWDRWKNIRTAPAAPAVT